MLGSGEQGNVKSGEEVNLNSQFTLAFLLLATLATFRQTLETSAQDDALAIVDGLLRDILAVGSPPQFTLP